MTGSDGESPGEDQWPSPPPPSKAAVHPGLLKTGMDALRHHMDRGFQVSLVRTSPSHTLTRSLHEWPSRGARSGNFLLLSVLCVIKLQCLLLHPRRNPLCLVMNTGGPASVAHVRGGVSLCKWEKEEEKTKKTSPTPGAGLPGSTSREAATGIGKEGQGGAGNASA